MSNFIEIDDDTVVNKSLIASIVKENIQNRYTSDVSYEIYVTYTTEYIQKLHFEYENLRDLEYNRLISELLEN